MKNKVKIIIVSFIGVVTAIGIAVGIIANNQSSTGSNTTSEQREPVRTDMDYYGCPNSNRVKKLNLRKDRNRINK